MKKLFLLLTSLFLMNCDDGDLTIERIDFSNTALTQCQSTASSNNTLYFKLQDKEALIISIAAGVLQNVVGERESSIPSASKLYYRTFNNAVSNAYFCDVIPPSNIAVTKELQATAGTLRVVTTQETVNDVLQYKHSLTIENLVLDNTKNQEGLIDTHFILGELITK